METLETKLSVFVQSVITELDDAGNPVKDGRNTYTTETEGYFAPRDGGYRLRYTEKTDNGPVTTILWFPEVRSGVTVTSTGARNAGIRLFPGETHESVYEIPPFRFPLKATLLAVNNTLCHNGGKMILSYRLDIGGQPEKVSLLVRTSLPADKSEEDNT